jgi:hypothetical protein
MMVVKYSRHKDSRLKVKRAPYDWVRAADDNKNISTSRRSGFSTGLAKSDLFFNLHGRQEKKFLQTRKVAYTFLARCERVR